MPGKGSVEPGEGCGVTALFWILGGLALAYLMCSVFLTYMVHQMPRKHIRDAPDWGRVTDARIPTANGGELEVWRVEPEEASRGIVVLAHGWSRNRDRMVYRARLFGQWGFTTVLHSARDHGGSSPQKGMGAPKFAEDLEAVLQWVGEPVILYGHSLGAAASCMTAHANPEKIKFLFLEGCYPYTEAALLNLYRWASRFLGYVFGPMIIFWMNLYYKGGLDSISPARLAPGIKMPVMLIHGEKDRRFPIEFMRTLEKQFAAGQTEVYVAEGAGHSNSSRTPGYPDAVKAFLDRHAPR
ncbi:MAG: alpha/beta fold hydrolase [Desulfobacterales bacterium]|nr:alpha/beta fold hydrolase [Desulfobacterales bacterium]